MRTPTSKAGLNVVGTAIAVLASVGCGGKPLGGGTGGSPGTGGVSCTWTDSCGGTSGSPVDASAVCEQQAQRYQTILTAARFCTPGAPNQCQSLVANVPSNCPGSVCDELMYVNDGASVEAARQSWLNENCGGGPTLCIARACDPPTPPGVCSPDGICVFAGADGGTSSTTDGGGTNVGPDGGKSCARLAADYRAAVAAAQVCTPGAPGQCDEVAATFATTCPITGCGDETYVNASGAAGISEAIDRWIAQCQQPVACSDIVCVPPQLPAYTCVASSASDGGSTRGTCTPTP